MMNFYIKQNLDKFSLMNLMINISNFNIDEICIINSEKFTPDNKEYDFNKFKVICTY